LSYSLQDASSSHAIIDLSAVRSNIRFFRELVGADTDIIAVVKADAYGHGMLEVSRTALSAGCAMLAVAEVSEGAFLRQNGITAPVLVMGGSLPADMRHAVENSLQVLVYTKDQLLALDRAAGDNHKRAGFHLKIDTGMNRIGIGSDDELSDILKTVKACANLEFAGLMSHFSTADEEDLSFTQQQFGRFAHAAQIVADAGYHPKKHIANSAGAAFCDAAGMDYIRLGIAMYGLQPSAGKALPLTPALSWTTRIVHIKTIHAGDSISYGRKFTAAGDMRVATLPVGYADGFSRLLSNKADVLIRGRRARVLGNVCMDHVMVDVSDIADAGVGDTAVVIGRDGEESVTAAELADLMGTISYEIVTRIGSRVKRIYLNE